MHTPNPSSSWAATMLPLAPTREVADRLIAMVDDATLFTVSSTIPVGVSLPPRGVKMTAARAEFFARTVSDPADIARLERDPRIGVRRILCQNRAARTEWVDSVLARAAAGVIDSDTVKAAAPAASTGALISTLPDVLHLTAPALADRVAAGRCSAAEQIAAAPHLLVDLSMLSPNLESPWQSAGQLLAALGAHGDVAAVCDAVPALAGPLLMVAVRRRPLDRALASVLVRHAESFDRAVTGMSKAGAAQQFRCGVPALDVEPAVVELLARSGSPALATLVAQQSELSGETLDAVLDTADDSTVRALSKNRKVTYTTVQADRLVAMAVTLAERLAPWSTRYSPHRDTEASMELLEHGITCSPPAMLSLLQAGSGAFTKRWLLGQLPQVPRPTEISALFTAPGHAFDGFHPTTYLWAFLEVRAAGLPWEPELRRVSPTAVTYNDNVVWNTPEALTTFIGLVSDQLGDDPEVWATFVSLAPTFPGDIADAVATAVAVTA